MSFARWSASMRCMRERSGASTALGGDSLTGGIGGDYTSCCRAINPKKANSALAQVEVKHCRARLR
jgi:hypothetical protein